MRTIIYLAVAVWLAGLGTMAMAQTATNDNSVPLSLTDCIQLALENNLDLQIERINPEIARYGLSLAYAGYEPAFTGEAVRSFSRVGGGVDQNNLPFPAAQTDRDTVRTGIGGVLPTGLSYDISGSTTDTEGTRGGANFMDTSGSVSIQLRQPLLRNFWIDSTRLNIRVNRNLLRSSEEGFRLQLMNIVTSVETTYYDLLLAIESVKVQEKALQLAERLYQENRRRVEVGTMAPLDEKQAESQAATTRADLLAARRNLERQENLVKSLLTDDYASWQGLRLEPTDSMQAMPPMFDLQESWRWGMELRPDLRQVQLEVERLGLQLKYDFNQLFPQLDVVGSYGRSGNASTEGYDGVFSDIRDETSPFYSYGVVVTVPLGNKAAREQYKTGKAQKAQALLRLKRLEQNVLVEIDDALKLAQSSYERVGATKQAREYAEAALEAEEKKLANGRSTSFVVLQLQRDLTSARSAEVQALADYNKALAQLTLNEGRTLEKNQINYDLK